MNPTEIIILLEFYSFGSKNKFLSRSDILGSEKKSAQKKNAFSRKTDIKASYAIHVFSKLFEPKPDFHAYHAHARRKDSIKYDRHASYYMPDIICGIL